MSSKKKQKTIQRSTHLSPNEAALIDKALIIERLKFSVWSGRILLEKARQIIKESEEK